MCTVKDIRVTITESYLANCLTIFRVRKKESYFMHQSIPAVPIPPPGNHGAFAQMSVPGVGH